MVDTQSHTVILVLKIEKTQSALYDEGWPLATRIESQTWECPVQVRAVTHYN